MKYYDSNYDSLKRKFIKIQLFASRSCSLFNKKYILNEMNRKI